MSAEEFAGVVADVLDLDPDEVVDDAAPGRVGSWTSLRHIQLVVALEDVYGLSFTPDEIRSFTSIGAVRRTLTGRGIAV